MLASQSLMLTADQHILKTSGIKVVNKSRQPHLFEAGRAV